MERLCPSTALMASKVPHDFSRTSKRSSLFLATVQNNFAFTSAGWLGPTSCASFTILLIKTHPTVRFEEGLLQVEVAPTWPEPPMAGDVRDHVGLSSSLVHALLVPELPFTPVVGDPGKL